jgi:plastocyanin
MGAIVLFVFVVGCIDLELFRIRYVTLAAALALMLTVAPVYAAPNLKIGSTASYNLATSVSATQSCTASPANFYNQACLGIYPPTAFVTISDDGHCGTGTLPPNDPFSALRCRFTPDNVTLPIGSEVVWFNSGNITHAITSNTTANIGLPSFSSGPIFPGGRFSLVFNQTGTYRYYDPNYTPYLTDGLMRGVVDVTPPLPPPPTVKPPSFQVGLNGNVGWTVQGLSSSTANLLVSHNLAVSIPVPQLPIVSITPVTESGTLVQSIDLATRVESAGTATDLIEHVLDALAASSSSQGFNPGLGNIISQMSASATSDPSYTVWWVNGPISNGSPVQVMDGWASVTGSETLNLGDLGNVQAWIVTSQFTQGANLAVPSSPFAGPSPNAQAVINLNFLWSYDKGSDLLARSFANGTITMHSSSTTQVPTNGICNGFGCTYTTVQVTRDMRLTVTMGLHLTSTSLSLDQRMRNGPSTIDMASMLASMFATPWSALGFIGVVATAIIGFSLWFSRRVRRSAIPEATPAIVPGPSTPPS